MKEFSFICLYCNHKWKEYLYILLSSRKCPICTDKNLIIKEVNDDKTVDYYGKKK